MLTISAAISKQCDHPKMRGLTMKILLSIFMIFGAFFVSSASGSTPKDADPVSMDDIFRKSIIGKWSEGEMPYGISSFEEGGIYRAWLYEDAKREKLLHSMTGTWWIEKDKLYNAVSEITPPIPGLKTGDVVIDRIVNISEDVMTLIDETGLQYTNKRIKE